MHTCYLKPPLPAVTGDVSWSTYLYLTVLYLYGSMHLLQGMIIHFCVSRCRVLSYPLLGCPCLEQRAESGFIHPACQVPPFFNVQIFMGYCVFVCLFFLVQCVQNVRSPLKSTSRAVICHIVRKSLHILGHDVKALGLFQSKKLATSAKEPNLLKPHLFFLS